MNLERSAKELIEEGYELISPAQREARKNTLKDKAQKMGDTLLCKMLKIIR
ncbi:hypothetical protein ACT7C2_01490 [Bacillus pacificus]